MGTISKNFSWSEFENSPTAKAKTRKKEGA